MHTKLAALLIFILSGSVSPSISLRKFIDVNSHHLNQFFDSERPSRSLGSECTTSDDCLHILQAECRENMCACTGDYYHDTVHDVCQKGSRFGDYCSEKLPCMQPFSCESGSCACPKEFVKYGEQCLRKCSKGEISVTEWDHKCVKLRDLGEECAYNEQCQTKFSECVRGRCTCRMGTTNVEDKVCLAAPQCPFGPAPLVNDSAILCLVSNSDGCPQGHHCQPMNYGKADGFCCPVAAPRCPFGFPLQNTDCSSCPYDTHNCYTFSVGSRQHSLCCPNDCHRSAPIRFQGKCLPPVPSGGECQSDEQCDHLTPGAVCNNSICACPQKTAVKNGKCRPLSPWDGECSVDTDCYGESQLRCLDGKCKCAPEHVPEPGVTNASRCIPASTCPTATGLFRKVSSFTECGSEKKCADNEFCRKWWQDSVTQRSYSLCCPKPGVHDYTIVCGRFGMSLVLTNSIDALARPLPCGLSPMEGQTDCPEGAACVFNPYSEGDGICCRAHTN